MTLADFRSNRDLIAELESGNRYLINRIEYRFSLFAFSLSHIRSFGHIKESHIVIS